MMTQLPYNSTDFLRPIREDANRDEYILMEFHRVLRNTNMSLLLNIIERAAVDPEVLEVFPALGDFAKLNIDGIFTATVLYNHPWELVKRLSDDKLTDDMCKNFVTMFREPYNFDAIQHSQLEGVMRKLLDAKFVKNLYIIADNFSKEMETYIISLFGDKGINTTVIPLMGTWMEAAVEYPQLTTFFISNSDELIQLSKEHPDAIKNRLFVILDGYNNLEPKKVGNEVIMQYKYMTTFESWHKKKICSVGFAYPHFVPIMPTQSLREDENPTSQERNETTDVN